MKKTLRPLLLLIVIIFTAACAAHSQSIHVVPNPNAPSLFAWTGDGGALSGYAGTPILLNDALVLEYNGTESSDPTDIKLQLAVYKTGDSLHLITNPDAGQGVYLHSIQIIFNNKLFIIYIDAAGKQRLASFDGTSITLYPNPDGGLGYIGSPRILNNELYVAYSNAAGVTQLGKFTGTGITLIANPDNNTSTTGAYYNNYSIVFDNKICSRYVMADGTKHLATYDGTKWTILPNPDNTSRGFIPVFPVLYHNKLYITYYSATNQYQYMVYDGVNNPTLIANPQASGDNDGGVSGFPIIANDTLFFQYYDVNNVLVLAKFGGTSISLVPNPDATTYGFYNTPIVYNNNLYIFYVTADGKHHLTQYQSATNSLKVFPNPDAGNGYWDQPIVYDNQLFFMYYNAQSSFQLGYFGGTSIKLVPNPPGEYNGAAGNNGYTGQPYIWNNLLYMQFGSVPYGDAGNLAYIDGITLPLTLLDFNAQKVATSTVLQWKTANENNAYFTVEHSTDGVSFQPIGRVTGATGNEQVYRYTDKNVSKGINYYRLKQVDYNNNVTYSGIAVVSFDNGAFALKAFPNPALNMVTITLPSFAGTSVVSVYDLGGKKVLQKQLLPGIVSQSIDVSTLAKGTYTLKLVQGSQQQTLKLVRQ